MDSQHQNKNQGEATVTEKYKEEHLNQNEHADIDPAKLDMLELLEYLHSIQGKKVMEEYNEKNVSAFIFPGD